MPTRSQLADFAFADVLANDPATGPQAFKCRGALPIPNPAYKPRIHIPSSFLR
jgi:hypothetical protein